MVHSDRTVVVIRYAIVIVDITATDKLTRNSFPSDLEAVYTNDSEEYTKAVFRAELKSRGCMFHLLECTMSH